LQFLLSFFLNFIWPTAVCIPSFVASGFYFTYYTNHLFKTTKQNLDECILCREVKASALYISLNTILPACSSWFGAYVLADFLKTYPLPSVTKKILTNKTLRSVLFSDLKRIFVKTNKGFTPLFFKVFCFQYFLVNIISYFQAKQFYDIEDKLVFERNDFSIAINSPPENVVQKIYKFFKK
jgi:hypothetical protein